MVKNLVHKNYDSITIPTLSNSQKRHSYMNNFIQPFIHTYLIVTNYPSFLLHLCPNILLIKLNRIIPIFGPTGMLDKYGLIY